MAAKQIVLPNSSTDPFWEILQEELWTLLADLSDDPKYGKRVTLIRALVTRPQCVQAEQVCFEPDKQPWPT